MIATAALIGGIFGKGGGNELGNAVALEEAKDRYGGAAGEQAWRDFRRQDDPEAPTTVKSGNGSFDYPRSRGSSGVALPDEGSLVDPPNNTSSPLVPGGRAAVRRPAQPVNGMSNALLVSGAESESGRPVAVMGPQVAYFMPQILVELDLHGPDIDAQGAAFAGVSPYMLLGRGQDFAWSATSAGQDIIDTFAEKLCEPDGSAPDVQSTHYLYKGECRPMEILTRVNNITPNPGDPSPPETYTLEAQRTVHGIVAKRGTVDGQPVAFARQRSTLLPRGRLGARIRGPQPPVEGPERGGLPARGAPRSTSRSTGSTSTTATSATSTRATTPSVPPAPTPTSRTGARASTTGRAGRRTSRAPT